MFLPGKVDGRMLAVGSVVHRSHVDDGIAGLLAAGRIGRRRALSSSAETGRLFAASARSTRSSGGAHSHVILRQVRK